jgi:hypothetical protein
MKTLLCLMLLSTGAFAQERWFEVQIAGKPAGRAHEVVRRVDSALETESDSETVIGRLEAKLDLKVRAKLIEAEDGTLRAAHIETAISLALFWFANPSALGLAIALLCLFWVVALVWIRFARRRALRSLQMIGKLREEVGA